MLADSPDCCPRGFGMLPLPYPLGPTSPASQHPRWQSTPCTKCTAALVNHLFGLELHFCSPLVTVPVLLQDGHCSSVLLMGWGPRKTNSRRTGTFLCDFQTAAAELGCRRRTFMRHRHL